MFDASVSQGRICSDNFTYCHTEIEVADQTFRFPQSQYTDTGLTSPSTGPITPGAWQGRATHTHTPGIFRSRGGRHSHQANEAARGSRGAASTTVIAAIATAASVERHPGSRIRAGVSMSSHTG